MANYSDCVIISKARLNELAQALQKSSGVSDSMTIEQMIEVAGEGGSAVLSALIDRSIKEIEIPLSVTTIGRNTFTYCNSLENVKLHEGITLIGASAFANCGALKEFEFPKSISTLAFGVLQSCSRLKKVTIPDTVTTIGQQALGFCSSLATLTLPNSVNDINPSAFVDSKKLVTIYCDWAEGEKPNIESKAPWGAVNADIIYLGSTKGVTFELNDDGNGYTVTGFDMDLYSELYNYEPIDLVIGPQHNGLPVTAIKEYAFDRSGYGSPIVAKSVSLPDTLKSIGACAFSDQSIVSLTIPDGVTDIGYGAFQYNSSLSEVTLGAGCKNMPADVFMGCSSLTNITAHWADNVITNAPWGAVNAEITYDATYGTYGLQYEYDDTLGGYVVTGYEYDEDKSSEAVVIPEIHSGRPVVAIGDEAFNTQSNACNYLITSVIIPEGVKSIGYSAFEFQGNLASLELPSTMESIGSYAFSDCSSLADISIPSSTTNIGENAFKGCVSLGNITVGENNNSYKSINGVFYSKDGKTLIKYPSKRGDTIFVVPQSVENISDYAFEGCGSGFIINLAYVNRNISGEPWGANGATVTYEYTDSGGGGVVAPDDWT